MERIALVCTSLNPNVELLNKMLNSASNHFDAILLNVDPASKVFGWKIESPLVQWAFTPKSMGIGEAYNYIIENYVRTEWVCCFCDDDYFYPTLLKMIEEVHKGIDADIAHFKFKVSGYCPREDLRARVFGKEYILCEKQPITSKLLAKHNRLPAGSFFRKSAWEKVGGYQGDKMHDWDLWKRMAKANCTFKYFDHLVYNLVRRLNSAWIRQNKE